MSVAHTEPAPTATPPGRPRSCTWPRGGPDVSANPTTFVARLTGAWPPPTRTAATTTKAATTMIPSRQRRQPFPRPPPDGNARSLRHVKVKTELHDVLDRLVHALQRHAAAIHVAHLVHVSGQDHDALGSQHLARPRDRAQTRRQIQRAAR